MNQRDKLKQQKKRLQHYHSSRLDAMSAGSLLGRTTLSIISGMLRESLTVRIIKIIQNTKWQYYLLSKETPFSSYSSANHITILSSGGRR